MFAVSVKENERMDHDPLCEIASHPHLYPYAPHWCTCRQIMKWRTSQGWRAPEPGNVQYRKFLKPTAH